MMRRLNLDRLALPRRVQLPPLDPGRQEAGNAMAAGAGRFLRAATWPFRAINWRVVFAALFGMGILHIIATLAAPHLAIATAFDRLKGVLPANRIVVLPPVEPGAQPLPFLSSALRYAMCRFDAGSAPVEVEVELSTPGSSLTIYSTDGEAIYTAAAGEVAQHRVRILPTDGRFLGLTPQARGEPSSQFSAASVQARRGLVVYALPERGEAYQPTIKRMLERATCQVKPEAGR